MELTGLGYRLGGWEDKTSEELWNEKERGGVILGSGEAAMHVSFLGQP